MNSSTTLACALCVGDAEEPYLDATLASIAPAVDFLCVNDNSGNSAHANRRVLEASPFARRGALHVRSHAFVDFADMRNRAFAMLAALDKPPAWVLFLDADEVHGEQLRYIARQILPHLDGGVGQVDTYTYNFFGTFHWISDVARRFTFYRYDPALRWVNPVHEKIEGVRGRAVTLPYIYHHYGNVLPPAMLAAKHGRYFELGNRVPRPPDPVGATAAQYLAQAHRLRPYRGSHPRAAHGALERMEGAHAADLAALDAAISRARTLPDRYAAVLAQLNETLRVALRHAEHPALYRAPMRAQ